MKRLLLSALAAAVLLTGFTALPGCNGARDNALNAVADGPKGFSIKTFTRGTRTRKYGVFIPYASAGASGYPVIVFLHGIGEGGNDARSNLRVGLAPFVADQAQTFPFVCIFPQSGSGGWNENSEEASDIFTALEDVTKITKVDLDRVSLTGLSTGGYGTWAIGAKYNDRFAALVPMGSNGTPSGVESQLVNMHIRAYCNGSDMFAGFGGNDRGMVERVKAAGGKDCEFTQTDGSGHDCWDIVYPQGELFAWLQQQRRHGATRASSSAAPVAAPKATPTAAAAPSSGIRTNAGVIVNTPY